MQDLPAKNIIFFDGVCSLCNRAIDFLITHDKERQLVYAPLQGETFQSVKQAHPELEGVESMVLVQNVSGDMRISLRSTAALRAMALLPRPWSLAPIFLIIPPFLRNLVYTIIARTRYKIFGRRDVCRLPTAEEKGLFLP